MPPKTEKPNKFITRLIEQTKTDKKRIEELERQVAANEVQTASAVNDALAAANKLADERLAKTIMAHVDEINAKDDQFRDYRNRMEAEVGRLRAERNTLIEQVDAANNRAHILANDLDHERQLRTDDTELIRSLRSKLEDVEPRIALLDAKEAELSKLCDKVRDRMRRKELDEERAILNRKAVVGLLPGGKG